MGWTHKEELQVFGIEVTTYAIEDYCFRLLSYVKNGDRGCERIQQRAKRSFAISEICATLKGVQIKITNPDIQNEKIRLDTSIQNVY